MGKKNNKKEKAVDVNKELEKKYQPIMVKMKNFFSTETVKSADTVETVETTAETVETTVKPTEEKPVETTVKPTEEKPVETTVKPTEEKPVETTVKPTEEKPVETTVKPAEVVDGEYIPAPLTASMQELAMFAKKVNKNGELFDSFENPLMFNFHPIRFNKETNQLMIWVPKQQQPA